MEIQWEEPPEEAIIRSRAGGSAKHIDFAIALRDHPEKWAVLPAPPYRTKESAQSAAQNIRRGVTKAFGPKGSYEAIANGDKIHVRFMGVPEEEEPKGKPDPGEPAASKPGDAADDEQESRKSFAPRVRAWAREQGIEVSEHGRLPQDLIDHYLADTGEDRPPHLQAVR